MRPARARSRYGATSASHAAGSVSIATVPTLTTTATPTLLHMPSQPPYELVHHRAPWTPQNVGRATAVRTGPALASYTHHSVGPPHPPSSYLSCSECAFGF